MSTDPAISNRLKLASQHVEICTVTLEGPVKMFYLGAAMDIFRPLSDTHPQAAFGAGLLAEHMAYYSLLYNPALEPVERLPATFTFIDKAAEYYRKAGSLPDIDGDLTPARALGSLAGLYDAGLMGVRNMDRYAQLFMYLDIAPDEIKASNNAYKHYARNMMHRSQILYGSDFVTMRDLYQESAEGGWAESQINLAIVLYRGEGVEEDKNAAYEWMTKALANKDQLPPHLQEEVFQMQQHIAQDIGKPLVRLERPPSPSSTGTSSLKPHTPD